MPQVAPKRTAARALHPLVAIGRRRFAEEWSAEDRAPTVTCRFEACSDSN